MSLASATARALATVARLARVLHEWMSWRWIDTPQELCQGSSAMPQKRNPVVLEHMQSIATSWWEDSNSTTDIQGRPWEMDDRGHRFFVMLQRVFEVLQPLNSPPDEEIVAQGTPTTA